MTAQDSRARQSECDLLVVGSGAGGLSAATTAAWHGLRVVVVEKDRVCGGATAWSGGWAWVPLNPLAQADGSAAAAEPRVRAAERRSVTMQPAEASRPAPRLLSISHLTVLDAPPPELVTAAADAGFDAVGIRVWPAADEPGYPMLGDTPMLRETLLRLADTGTCVLDVEVLRLRPDSRMDDALRILDAGARLQARAVLVICNDPEEDRLVERFAAVCEAAGERGLQACLEFMIFSSVKTIADAERVLNRAGHPAGAILVDALHLQRSGGTPADVSAVAPERLPYVQLCDGPFQPILPDSAVALTEAALTEAALTEARTGRLFPGDGELPLAELLGALPAGASLAIEAPVAGLAGRAIGERTRLAHAALIGLLAKANPSGDQADWGNGTLPAVD